MQEHKNLQEFRGADAKAIANLGSVIAARV